MDRQKFLSTLHKVMADSTQAAFARRLGVSAGLLSRIRSGQRRPGWRVIRALLREFPEVSLAEWGLSEPGDKPQDAPRPWDTQDKRGRSSQPAQDGKPCP